MGSLSLVCVCVCPVCACVSVCCVCACVSVFVCVLPHLYNGVCVMQVCNVRVHLEDQIGTQCMYNDSILGDTIHVQKAWYTN